MLSFLSGCQISPEQHAKMLALSPQQFAQLNPETLKNYDDAYHQNLQALSNELSKSHMPRHQHIQIKIHGGMAQFSPDYTTYAFQSTYVDIPANRCIDTQLTASRNPEKQTQLSLCYLNDTLYVDSSSTNTHYPIGSIQLPIQYRLSQMQQFCQLNSQGNTKLHDSCITIQHHNTDPTLPTQTLTLAPENTSFVVKPRVPIKDPIIPYE